MRERWADLHLHTRWSDGTLDVSATAERSRSAGLSAIAITDHDTVSPELVQPVEKRDGLEIICGVELKAEIEGERGEILGHFVAPGHPALREIFRLMAESREQRMGEMVHRCQEVLGEEISFSEVRAGAPGSLGRPHLAAALIRHGLARDYDDAFRRYLARGMPCYVPLPRPPSRQVISTIRAAGGVSTLAHPCFLRLDDWERSLASLVAEGLVGVEVHYPYQVSRQTLHAQPGEVIRLVQRLRLVPAGGSDDHGPGSVKESMGLVRVPYAVVEELSSRASPVT